MTNILVVHGKENNSEGNWFPWLKVFEQYEDHVTPDTIVVGHSLGAPFLLNIMELM